MVRLGFRGWVFVGLSGVLLLYSCHEQGNAGDGSSMQMFPVPLTTPISGSLPHPDSLQEPTVIAVDTNVLPRINAGNPVALDIPQKMFIAGYKSLPALEPEIRRPADTLYSLPKVVCVWDSTVVGGIPESKEALPPHIRDNNPFAFSSYGKLNGLPHSNISCIEEDHKGNLWIGSIGGGLTCFNGTRFTTYTEDHGLCFNGIWTVLEDSKRNLWIGTYGGGISKYDGKHFTTIAMKHGLPNDQVWSILEDRDGVMWFGTDGGGLCRYDGDKFKIFTTEQGLTDNSVLSLFQDKNGLLWIGTANGLCSYDGEKIAVYTTKQGMSGSRIWTIYQSSDGDLWFGTEDGGVNRFDGKTFRHFTTAEGLPHNCVTSVLEDEDKFIWFGTLNGLCRFDGGKHLRIFNEDDGLSSNKILDVHQDASGNLWLGTVEGGLCRYDGNIFNHFSEEQGLPSQIIWSVHEARDGFMWFGSENGVINGPRVRYSKSQGLGDDIILSIFSDRNGDMWFGTYGGGVTKFDGTDFIQFTQTHGFPNDRVWSILQDDNGNMWMATYGAGAVMFDGTSFHQYTTANGLCDNKILCMHKDQSGNLWFGTENGGLTKRTSDGKFRHYSEKTGLPNNRIWCIDSDRHGNVWIGTFGGGLCKINDDEITVFKESDGLSSNFVFAMTFDAEQNLWVGTRQGLSCMRNETIDLIEKKKSLLEPCFVNFSYRDGFYGMGVIGGETMVCDRMGNIWIGSNDRLTRVDSRNALKTQIAPEIELFRIEVFNEQIPWNELETNRDSLIKLGNGTEFKDYHFDSTTYWTHRPSNLNLSFANNYLTFHFSGITQFQPDRLQYRYILKGHDNGWSALTDQSEVTYGNLPDGEYIFRVKAMNSFGAWSRTEEFAFVIRPPWWRTWWFRTASVCTLIFTLLGIYRWRTASLRHRQKELEETVAERTSEVVAEKHEVERQKELVEAKQKEIIDSINYAKRIQRAILPPDKLIAALLPRSFVLYRPKDIVAGDFYWMTKIDDIVFFAVADCTGHGVPGALVSVVCHNGLNRAVKEFGLTEPGRILDKTREIVVAEFEKSDEVVRDGMDIALCSIGQTQVCFAGAHNPLWIVRRTSEVVEEISADSQPVGKFDNLRPYTTHEIELEPGDQIYLFSDGFADQFGGHKGKKFKTSNLKKLILSVRYDDPETQREKLISALENWMGNLEQLDDICIVGFRL